MLPLETYLDLPLKFPEYNSDVFIIYLGEDVLHDVCYS